MSNGYQAERLPQKSECREDSEGGILESASTFAYRVLKEIEALAGTTACKSVQLVRLKQWAQEQGRWFDDRTQFGDFFDRGSENEVYLSQNGTEIIKLNDFRYSDDNLTPFFERIKAHNSYFPDCSYCLVGFAENRDGNVCAVLFWYSPLLPKLDWPQNKRFTTSLSVLASIRRTMADITPTTSTISLMPLMAMFSLMMTATCTLLTLSYSSQAPEGRKHTIAYHREQARNKLTYDEP